MHVHQVRPRVLPPRARRERAAADVVDRLPRRVHVDDHLLRLLAPRRHRQRHAHVGPIAIAPASGPKTRCTSDRRVGAERVGARLHRQGPGEELVTLTTARVAGRSEAARAPRAAGGARGGRRAPSVVGAAASKVACSAYVSPVVGHTPGWMTGRSDARSDIHPPPPTAAAAAALAALAAATATAAACSTCRRTGSSSRRRPNCPCPCNSSSRSGRSRRRAGVAVVAPSLPSLRRGLPH